MKVTKSIDLIELLPLERDLEKLIVILILKNKYSILIEIALKHLMFQGDFYQHCLLRKIYIVLLYLSHIKLLIGKESQVK